MGSVRRLPNGRYQAQFRPVAGGKQITRTDPRRAVVQRWLDEQTAAQITGTYADSRAGKITLREYFSEWSQRQVWEDSTTRAMELAINSTPFLDVSLRAIERSHLEQWIKMMQTGRGTASQRPLAPGTIHTRVTNVRVVLRAAVADRRIPSDPSIGLKLPRRRKAEAAMQIPTTDQVRALLDGAPRPYRALIALAAFAGLRLGEAAAMQVDDVNFLGRAIHVRRQVQRVNGQRVDVRAPKYGSERDVAAADGLLGILAEHVAEQRLQGDPTAWLFRGLEDQPVHQNTVGHAWRQARAASGVEGFTLHDLRHFFASGLIASGCDISTVQHALGHATPSFTLNTYTHLWPKAEDRTRAAAQGLAAAVLGATDESVTNGEARSQR